MVWVCVDLDIGLIVYICDLISGWGLGRLCVILLIILLCFFYEIDFDWVVE